MEDEIVQEEVGIITTPIVECEVNADEPQEDIVIASNIRVEEDINNLPINISIYRNFAIIDEPEIINIEEKIVRHTVKTVKIETFVKAMSETTIDIVSPILPPNCIRYREKGNEVIVILFHEMAKFSADCQGERFDNCIRPNMVMVYYLNQTNGSYNIKTVKAYGIAESAGMIGPKTRLYGLPFPNVGSDGWVCWGSNSISGTFNSLVGLRIYVDRFFSTPFNSHLFNSSLLNMHGITGPQELFKALQDKDHFPVEYFENLGNKTLGDL